MAMRNLALILGQARRKLLTKADAESLCPISGTKSNFVIPNAVRNQVGRDKDVLE
jgi:hypothetical protein